MKIANKNYDEFHKSSRTMHKVINDNNFTYINILKILKETVIEKSTEIEILDIGCGVGTIDLFLANKGFRVTGVDISQKAVSVARETAKVLGIKNANFFNCSIERLKLNRGQFGLIICSEVLEHLKDDFKSLLKMKEFLKKKGKLIISVPSSNAPLYKCGLAKNFDQRVGHLRRYSLVAISSLIEKAGFEIIQISRTEGLIRNSLYLIKPLGFLIKFIRGPLVRIVSFIDKISIPLFGESQIFVIARSV